MPRATKALTDAACRNAKPEARTVKLSDGGGLYLEMLPSGAKRWRMKYRFAAGDRYLYFGAYPAVTLTEARRKRDDVRRMVADGIDPAIARTKAADPETFAAVADEWYRKQRHTYSESTAARVERILSRDLVPWLGKRPIADIEPPELLACLRRLESRGVHESAHRARQQASMIFRYAVACGYAQRDPTADLRGAIATVKTTHRAAVTKPAEVAELLRAIEAYQGVFTVKCALRLLPLVFVRPGELRAAEWSEIDTDAAQWVIPAERMKMRRPHIVPLTAQALAIIEDLRPLTGAGRYVLPGERGRDRPLSENTLNAALRRMGYTTEQMTAHGFRAMASTMLHERGYPPHVIEAQLAHAQRNAVAAAYNRAEYLPERMQMMKDWADYLDALRDQRKVVAGKFRRTA